MDDDGSDGSDGTAPEGGKAPRSVLSRKALLDRAVERSGVSRKADARASVEAGLAVLAEALAGGQDVNLGRAGRIKVQRAKEGPKGTTITLRLTVPRPGALADPGDSE